MSVESIIEKLMDKGSIPKIYKEEFGYVCETQGQIVTLFGLPKVQMGEIVIHTPSRSSGVVLQLNNSTAKVVILDNTLWNIGDEVIRSNKQLSVNVHESMFGKILNALGQEENQKVFLGENRNIFPEPKSFLKNEPIKRQLFTGVNSIDWMIPLGYGQRQLIIGNNQSGKSTLCQSIMYHQAKNFKNTISIYVLIGQCAKEGKAIQEKLLKAGRRNFIIFQTRSSDSAGLRYFVPYVATTVGEYFMDQGKDVLIFYDNLDTHAKSYRELSNMLQEPPGKETYPKDMFFQHSRLLERGICLKKGSLTLFPVVNILGEELDYISTNVISITDGQIFLRNQLLQQAHYPAIDLGLSVSRIGTAVMDENYKKLTKNLLVGQIEQLKEKTSIKLKSIEKQPTKDSIVYEITQQKAFETYEKWEQIILLEYIKKDKSFSVEKCQDFITKIKDKKVFKKQILAYDPKTIKEILGA